MPSRDATDSMRVDLTALPVTVKLTSVPVAVTVLGVERDYEGFLVYFAFSLTGGESWPKGQQSMLRSLTATASDVSGREYQYTGGRAVGSPSVVTGEWHFEPALDPECRHLELVISGNLRNFRGPGIGELIDAAADGFDMLDGVLRALERRHEVVDNIYNSKSEKAGLKALTGLGLTENAARMIARSLAVLSPESRRDLARGRDYAASDLKRHDKPR